MEHKCSKQTLKRVYQTIAESFQRYVDDIPEKRADDFMNFHLKQFETILKNKLENLEIKIDLQADIKFSFNQAINEKLYIELEYILYLFHNNFKDYNPEYFKAANEYEESKIVL